MTFTIEPTTPVFRAEEAVTVEVHLDSGLRDFTWAILSGDATPSSVLHSEHVQRTRSDQPEVYTLTGPALEPGGYHLVLYAGHQKGNWDNKRDRKAEDSFAVITPAASRITLVPEPPSGGDVRPFATYQSFHDFLANPGKNGGKGGKLGNPSTFTPFDGRNYKELKRLANQYVKSRRAQTLLDLAPAGYTRSRTRQEPLLPATQRDGNFFPCVELIWNYWLEEGMLVQTLNVILARFQNRRLGPNRDPLARFDVTPLLPLRSFLWRWAEDEVNRLTLRHRAAEYEYEYGLTLIGRAVPPTRMLVERRSGFLQAFHQILHQAHVFYKERDDLTVSADAFPLYRSLRECHLILSQGSHNQYGEMAVAARVDFLVMQRLLAEPQMREFLGGRPMTPYPEPWMDRVDTMKTLQGWTDTSIMHFHDLATFGEQLVLTIRLGNWAGPTVGAPEARTWADAFRTSIQKYVAAYLTVTGVDLARGVDATMPSTLIARQLRSQQQRA